MTGVAQLGIWVIFLISRIFSSSKVKGLVCLLGEFENLFLEASKGLRQLSRRVEPLRTEITFTSAYGEGQGCYDKN